MSTFPGKLKEYPFISIDRFDNENLSSTLFFLSHCHMDHMAGLDSRDFVKLLRKKNLRLYCSEASQLLLKCDERFKDAAEYSVALKENELYMFQVPEECLSVCKGTRQINVVLLGALHCLGSVMFLFEDSCGRDENRVLYTGDFRLTVDDLKKISFLRKNPSDGALKSFERVYLDTTFCDKRSKKFPSRDESFFMIRQHMHEWLSAAPEHMVLLYTASKYGHEVLFERVASTFKEKIHVSGWKARVFQDVPTLQPHITDDGYSTRVHACAYWTGEDDCGGTMENIKSSGTGNRMLDSEDEDLSDFGKAGLPIKKKMGSLKNCYCPCISADDPNVLIIKPSAMFFYQTGALRTAEWCKRVRSNYVRVFYSMHSSLEEIRDLVRFLKPKHLYANVVPTGSTSGRELSLLRDLVPVLKPQTNLTPLVTEPQPTLFDDKDTNDEVEKEQLQSIPKPIISSFYSDLPAESPEIGRKLPEEHVKVPEGSDDNMSSDHIISTDELQYVSSQSPILFSDDELQDSSRASKSSYVAIMPLSTPPCCTKFDWEQSDVVCLLANNTSASSGIVSSTSAFHASMETLINNNQNNQVIPQSGDALIVTSSLAPCDSVKVVNISAGVTEIITSSSKCPKLAHVESTDVSEISVLKTSLEIRRDLDIDNCCVVAEKECSKGSRITAEIENNNIIDITSSYENMTIPSHDENEIKHIADEDLELYIPDEPPQPPSSKKAKHLKIKDSCCSKTPETTSCCSTYSSGEISESEEQRRRRKSAGIKTPQKQFSSNVWLNKNMLTQPQSNESDTRKRASDKTEVNADGDVTVEFCSTSDDNTKRVPQHHSCIKRLPFSPPKKLPMKSALNLSTSRKRKKRACHREEVDKEGECKADDLELLEEKVKERTMLSANPRRRYVLN